MIRYPLQPRRRKTREVPIGNITVGGNNPIVIQSMITNGLSDLPNCMKEIELLVDAGCEMIRFAIPSMSELELVPGLRQQLVDRGINIPLVADIHFSPKLAEEACAFFEKIRINPGNYSDRPKNANKAGIQVTFEEGRENLRELLQPLIKNLKKFQRAVRIGVNQGSLSERMMEKFGDTPLGMVESALEMINIMENEGFTRIIVSLKSSNPLVVQKAYRLLAQRLPANDSIPFHLGVTEAGNGLMGRIKSLAGMGPLLADGIGDTIRVSLTEASQNEIPVARDLIQACSNLPSSSSNVQDYLEIPAHSHRLINGQHQVGKLLLGNGSSLKIGFPVGFSPPDTEIPMEPDFYYQQEHKKFFLKESPPVSESHIAVNGYKTEAREVLLCGESNCEISTIDLEKYSAILFPWKSSQFTIRGFLYQFPEKVCPLPLGILFPSGPTSTLSNLVSLASLLSDGWIDFLLLPPTVTVEEWKKLLYLLQATRKKIFTADFIACPSCSRTIFDLQKVTQTIKERTSHLKGVKIAIMGCIVNGPGEMADADFGYVGSGPGKVDLYHGQHKIKRSVDEGIAVEMLIRLIKEKGAWLEPS